MADLFFQEYERLSLFMQFFPGIGIHLFPGKAFFKYPGTTGSQQPAICPVEIYIREKYLGKFAEELCCVGLNLRAQFTVIGKFMLQLNQHRMGFFTQDILVFILVCFYQEPE